MILWNRLRYTVWAPAYDVIARAPGFDSARRLSIERLRLASADHVLIVGAATVVIEHDEPVALGGTYRAVTLVKPPDGEL